MPVGWIGFSTASPPDFPEDPVAARDFVATLVTNAGAEFVELYFEVLRDRAYALVVSLDDYKKLRAVMKNLEADEYIKLLLPEDAKDVDDNLIPGIKPSAPAP
jgi:hypothetical protein